MDIISDRIINVKLAYGNSILNVISAYAPQVGCPHEEKSQFYEHLEQIMRNIKPGEEIIIGAGINVMWDETGVASNKNTEATVSETEMKKGKMSLDSFKHIIWE